MRSISSQSGPRRARMLLALVATLAIGVVLGMTLTARTATAQAQRREFKATTGMMLNYVKPDKTADFEAVMTKLKEALVKSKSADRNKQAQGWRVYRAQEPGPNNSVLYVWYIDPAMTGTDYTVANILNEAFPAEVQKLYEQYSEAFAGGQAMVNLQLVSDFSR